MNLFMKDFKLVSDCWKNTIVVLMILMYILLRTARFMIMYDFFLTFYTMKISS